ncbi:MAG: hypothetical protein LBM68_06950 [Bacteroidales bacterium]|jgi:hypothetical protein|nr:hypothetical protein [Bacteroidales bacterium]
MFGLDTLLKSKAGKKQIKKLVETEVLPNFMPALENYALEHIHTMEAKHDCTVSFMIFPAKGKLYVGSAFLDENKTLINMENVQPVTEFVKTIINNYLE